MLSSKYLDIGEAIQYFTLHSLYWAHCRRQCRCRHQMVIAVASSNDEVIAASNGRPNFLLKLSIFDQNVKNSATFWEHYLFFNWSRDFSHHEFKITTYFWVLEASFKELIIFSSEICKKYSNYGWIYWYNACRLIAVCRQQFKNTAICPV